MLFSTSLDKRCVSLILALATITVTPHAFLFLPSAVQTFTLCSTFPVSSSKTENQQLGGKTQPALCLTLDLPCSTMAVVYPDLYDQLVSALLQLVFSFILSFLDSLGPFCDFTNKKFPLRTKHLQKRKCFL